VIKGLKKWETFRALEAVTDDLSFFGDGIGAE